MLRGIWVTVERDPAKAGGLGEVSKTIPAQLNNHLDVDVRVMVPGLAPILQQGEWLDTKQRLTLHWQGKPYTFSLLRQFEQQTATWVYAIANDLWFAPYPHLYFKENYHPDLGRDPLFAANMLFNQAAAGFIRLHQESFSQGNSTLSSNSWMEGPLDFVIGHDWLSGPVLGLLPDSLAVGKLFMLHNTYDEQRSPQYAQQALGLASPPAANTYGHFSPLEFSVFHADVVIANKNYVHSLVQKETLDFLIKNLYNKLVSNSLYDMHHGISDLYDARQTRALQQNGYTTLNTGWLDRLLVQPLSTVWPFNEVASKPEWAFHRWLLPNRELRHYKDTNKRALQKQLELTVDPRKVIITWIGRLDPIQKGFYLLMEEARTFLHHNPEAQLIIGGANSSDDPAIAAFIQSAHLDGSLKGRLCINDGFIDRQTVIRMCAGSDFFLMPSLYEPFGLAQLEAMKLGCIPIVHGVDGLRSTVSDPVIDQLDMQNHLKERVWDYGQVGVKIEQLNVPIYQSVVASQRKGEALTTQQRWALEDSQRKLRLALKRALAIHANQSDYFEIMRNGLRFVTMEHAWPAIIQRYKAPLHHAVYLARVRQSMNRSAGGGLPSGLPNLL